MDSFEANKIFGAVLGTIFVVFGGSLLANGLFHSEAPEKPGYTIVAAEAPAAGGAAAPAAEDPPVATLLASANAETGAAEFKKCQACHSGEKGGPNKVGPDLWDVVNRPVAAHEGFSYSAGIKEFSKGGETKWDFDHLYHFIKAPKQYVNGTAMGFAGIKDPQGRADLLAYLRTLSDSPAPLPVADAAPAAPAEGAAPAATAQADAAAAPASGAEAPTVGAAPAAAAAGTAAAPAAPAAPAAAPAAPAAAPAAPAAAPAPAAPAPAPAAPAPAAPPAPAAAPAPAAPAPAQQQGSAAPAAPAATQVAAAGDAKAGAQVFKKCQACHAVGPGAKNKVGPELNGIDGEAVALIEGYTFSPALMQFATTHPKWDDALLAQWLANPKGLVPGTKMAFPGLKKPEEIANVIAYLKSFDATGAGGPQ